MDKHVLTKEDIKVLKDASAKLASNEEALGYLSTTAENIHGTTRTIKKFTTANEKAKIIAFPGITFNSSSLNGKLNIKAPKARFSLKDTFFKVSSYLEEKINYQLLNSGCVIYKYDDQGRVYFICNNKPYYLNSTKTGCLSPEGIYADIKFTKDGYVDFLWDYSVDTTSFDYLYISRAYEKESNIIDLDSMRSHR